MKDWGFSFWSKEHGNWEGFKNKVLEEKLGGGTGKRGIGAHFSSSRNDQLNNRGEVLITIQKEEKNQSQKEDS